MRSQRLNAGPERTYALVFDKGDEPVAQITGFARENGITAARLSAIGAFSDVVLGYFTGKRKPTSASRSTSRSSAADPVAVGAAERHDPETGLALIRIGA